MKETAAEGLAAIRNRGARSNGLPAAGPRPLCAEHIALAWSQSTFTGTLVLVAFQEYVSGVWGHGGRTLVAARKGTFKGSVLLDVRQLDQASMGSECLVFGLATRARRRLDTSTTALRSSLCLVSIW